jgi:hypothetical protein
MKINVSIEATAQEMREFLGLPNVQPLQDEILQAISDNMKKGVAGFDALNLIRPLLPPQFHSMELFQKAFWDAFAREIPPTREVAAEKPETKAEENQK